VYPSNYWVSGIVTDTVANSETTLELCGRAIGDSYLDTLYSVGLHYVVILDTGTSKQ